MSEYVLTRIQAIQDELENLKKTIIYQLQTERKPTHIEGLWKGVEITDEDITEAKKAVFRDATQWDE